MGRGGARGHARAQHRLGILGLSAFKTSAITLPPFLPPSPPYRRVLPSLLPLYGCSSYPGGRTRGRTFSTHARGRPVTCLRGTAWFCALPGRRRTNGRFEHPTIRLQPLACLLYRLLPRAPAGSGAPRATVRVVTHRRGSRQHRHAYRRVSLTFLQRQNSSPSAWRHGKQTDRQTNRHGGTGNRQTDERTDGGLAFSRGRTGDRRRAARVRRGVAVAAP